MHNKQKEKKKRKMKWMRNNKYIKHITEFAWPFISHCTPFVTHYIYKMLLYTHANSLSIWFEWILMTSTQYDTIQNPIYTVQSAQHSTGVVERVVTKLLVSKMQSPSSYHRKRCDLWNSKTLTITGNGQFIKFLIEFTELQLRVLSSQLTRNICTMAHIPEN